MRSRVVTLLRATVGFVVLVLVFLASSTASAATLEELLRDGQVAAVPDSSYDTPVDVASIPTVEPASSVRSIVDLADSILRPARPVGHAYDSSVSVVAPKRSTWP